jgi:Acetyltransferase (isoleucine patch superfamily)
MTGEEIVKQMLSGQMYNDLSEFLVEAREKTVLLTNRYNASFGKSQQEREQILDQLLKSHGVNVYFEPNFRCEFGWNITIGNNFYANFDCVILDGGSVTIGDNVLIGPRCGIYTVNHAIDADERKMGGCYAKPIKIGNDVWIGGGVSITQGVSIGDNAIIGCGSVVTKDVPPNTIAAGNPCRALRAVTAEDRTGFCAEELSAF